MPPEPLSPDTLAQRFGHENAQDFYHYIENTVVPDLVYCGHFATAQDIRLLLRLTYLERSRNHNA